AHYNRLRLRVVVERFGPVLFPQAALFKAAKRQLVIDNLSRVDPRVARFDALRGASRAIQVVCPNRRTQPKDRIVRLLDRFVEAAHAEDGQRRPEYLFGCDARVFRHVRQKGRREEVPVVEALTPQAFPTRKHLCTAIDRVLHLAFDLVALARAMQGADYRALSQTVPDFEFLHTCDKLLGELIGDRVKQVEPLDGQTRLTTVEEATGRRRFYRIGDVRVIAYDHGVRATQLKRHAFDPLSRRSHHPAANFG